MKDRSIWQKSWDNWKTPKDFLDKWWLNQDFDPCPFNHDLKKWDWLLIEWKENNFVNPPYSQKLKEAFIHKAIIEKYKWKNTIMLLPVSTDTKIFHDYILPESHHIEFIKWRIKFAWYNTKWEWVENKCWMHWSMLVYFNIDKNEIK
jgi:hypothetical protein